MEKNLKKVVKCLICGQKCNGEESLQHINETGHNNWELLMNSKRGGDYGQEKSIRTRL